MRSELDRDFALRLAVLGQVNRFGPDYPGDVIFAHQHGLPRQDAHVDPADGFKAEKPVLVILDDHEPDFVHVRVQHHAQRLRGPGLLHRQHVAQRVHLHFVGVALDLFQHDLAHLLFIAGDGAGVAQFFQQGDLL